MMIKLDTMTLKSSYEVRKMNAALNGEKLVATPGAHSWDSRKFRT